jgi:aromatic ring-opening dioxygenase catalytic subunit (LigB family)
MPEDRVFGSLETGKWSGLIKMLSDEEVDVVILTVMKTADRMQVADFFTPLIKTK